MNSYTRSPIITRPTEAVRRSVGDARDGRVKVAGLTVTSTQALRAAERNAFELGRDNERGATTKG